MNHVFVRGQEAQAVAEWVAKRIPGCERGFGPCVAMLVVDKAPIAGVVFHNYAPEAGVMEMSIASVSRRWLSKAVLKAAHEYIFDQAGCQMAAMRSSEHNAQVAKVLPRIGYVPHRIPRLRGRDEAEIIYTLTDDDWRSSKLSR